MQPYTLKSDKKYEPVIDGLRAIAVLVVVLFHADISLFPGGFIGVDIFFVISGYLITRNILHNWEKGQFSFTDFYLRRARRIFPAMFATLAITFMAGIFILFPVHLQRLAESTMYASTGLSNFFFWSEAGYWDITKNFKPLLHFWSLAVEEQFYLFWPAFIIGFLSIIKNKSIAKLGIALLIISLISLFSSQTWLSTESSTAFYLMPFRIFEFGIGAGILWLRQCPDYAKILSSVLSVLGLAAILYATSFYSETAPFPGVYALVPCLGSALVIYGRNSPIMKILLGNKIMVGIGLISYSLYLVHWPLFVFYKYVPTTPDTHLANLALILSAVGIAYLMYRYIEQPFRQPRRKNEKALATKPFFAVVVGLSAILIVASSVISTQSGVFGRFANQEITITSQDIKKMREDIHVLEYERRDTNFFGTHPAKFIIIGDSYSRDIMNALEYNGVKYPVKRFRIRAGCLPLVGKTPIGSHPKIKSKEDQEKCVDSFMSVLDSKELKNAEVIMLAAHWYRFGLDRFAQTINDIKKRTDAPVVVFGHRMMSREAVPDVVTRYGYKNGLDEFVNKTMDKQGSLALNASIEKVVASTGALYVNIIPILCPDLMCPILLENGSISMIDSGHWSLDGAKLFGQRLRSSNTPVTNLLFATDG